MRIKIHDELLPEGVSAADVLLALEVERDEPEQALGVVWLLSDIRGHVYGVFSAPGKAKSAAQEMSPSPLKWRNYGDYHGATTSPDGEMFVVSLRQLDE